MKYLRLLGAVIIAALATAMITVPANAASTAFGYGNCTVELNKPHRSSHAEYRVNIEFKAFGCTVSTGIAVDSKFSAVITHGDGTVSSVSDSAWVAVGTISTQGTGYPSSIYRNDILCEAYDHMETTVTARFKRGTITRTLTESNTVDCVPYSSP